MLKDGTERFQPHHMNSVLVETWEDFKVSSGNIIRGSFTKTRLPPLSPTKTIKNAQSCVDFIQKSSKGINKIAEDTLATIKLLTSRTNYSMVIIRENCSTRQPSRNLILR